METKGGVTYLDPIDLVAEILIKPLHGEDGPGYVILGYVPSRQGYCYVVVPVSPQTSRTEARCDLENAMNTLDYLLEHPDVTAI